MPNLQSLAPEAIDPAGYGPDRALSQHGARLQHETACRSSRRVVGGFLGSRASRSSWCRRVIELTPGLLFLLQANVLNGGTYDNLEPGFDAMRRLKPNLRRFYRSIGEVRPMLNNENVVVAISTNIMQGEIDRGNPIAVVMPEEGCLASPAVGAGRASGTGSKAMAERFIDYLPPSGRAERLGTASTSSSVFNQKADVPPDLKSRIGEQIVFFDADKVSRGREAWIDRWTREVRG